MGVTWGLGVVREALGWPPLTSYEAVDDSLVDAPVPIHSIDGPRPQDEGGWLWGPGEEGVHRLA